MTGTAGQWLIQIMTAAALLAWTWFGFECIRLVRDIRRAVAAEIQARAAREEQS